MAAVVRVACLLLFLVLNNAAQTTLCVWNSILEWNELNGEYILQNDTWNTRSYWKQSQSPTPGPEPTTLCPETPYYLFIASEYTTPYRAYWTMMTSLILYTYNGWPYCKTQPTPEDPTQCNTDDWIESNTLPLTVTDGPCPPLNYTLSPTISPTNYQTLSPAPSPTFNPISFSISHPTLLATTSPTIDPTLSATPLPTSSPTFNPTSFLTFYATLLSPIKQTQVEIDPTSEQTQKPDNIVSAVIGIVCGVIGLLIVIGIIVYFHGYKRREKNEIDGLRMIVASPMKTAIVAVDNEKQITEGEADVEVEIGEVNDEVSDKTVENAKCNQNNATHDYRTTKGRTPGYRTSGKTIYIK